MFREKRILALLRRPVGMIQTPPLSHPPNGLLDEIPGASRRRNGLNSPENTKFNSESKRIPVSHPFTFPTAGAVPRDNICEYIYLVILQIVRGVAGEVGRRPGTSVVNGISNQTPPSPMLLSANTLNL